MQWRWPTLDSFNLRNCQVEYSLASTNTEPKLCITFWKLLDCILKVNILYLCSWRSAHILAGVWPHLMSASFLPHPISCLPFGLINISKLRCHPEIGSTVVLFLIQPYEVTLISSTNRICNKSDAWICVMIEYHEGVVQQSVPKTILEFRLWKWIKKKASLLQRPDSHKV